MSSSEESGWFKRIGKRFGKSDKQEEQSPSVVPAVKPESGGYYIDTSECIGCRSCKNACPQDCIDFSSVSGRIMQENCLRCGNCAKVCPADAIKKKEE